jgi:hypothetical protein
MSRPNLFHFATSELSQDAFVGWLLSWADPPYEKEDSALHATGVHFLNALFEKYGMPPPAKYTKVEVKKQFHNIDILAIINEYIPIIIEDKIHSKQRSNQLARYFQTVQKDSCMGDFPKIYLKTGDQDCYENVENNKYAIFLRSDLLNVLRYGREKGVDNPIYNDFLDNLTSIDNTVSGYRVKRPSEWINKDPCWTGFYMELQKQLHCGYWNYVPNKGGGFMNFFWHPKYDWKPYLQLEEKRLCFKITQPDKSKQSADRGDWFNRLKAEAEKAGLPIVRPDRFGKGKTMTVAVYDGDYRKTDARGILDMDATIDVLKKAKSLMDSVQNEDAVKE